MELIDAPFPSKGKFCVNAIEEMDISPDSVFQLMIARSLAAQKSSLAHLPEEKWDKIQENAQDFAYPTFNVILSADLPQEVVETV